MIFSLAYACDFLGGEIEKNIFWTFFVELCNQQTLLTTVLLLRWCRRSTLRRRGRHAEALEGMPLQPLASIVLHPNVTAHRLSVVPIMTGGILSVSTVRLPTRTI